MHYAVDSTDAFVIRLNTYLEMGMEFTLASTMATEDVLKLSS